MVLHQQKGWTGGGGWGHLQDDMHMVAARLGFQSAMNSVVYEPNNTPVV